MKATATIILPDLHPLVMILFGEQVIVEYTLCWCQAYNRDIDYHPYVIFGMN